MPHGFCGIWLRVLPPFLLLLEITCCRAFITRLPPSRWMVGRTGCGHWLMMQLWSKRHSNLFSCMLLLCLATSIVQLSVTQWTAACQAPPSLGFSRQEYWCGCSVVYGPSINTPSSVCSWTFHTYLHIYLSVFIFFSYLFLCFAIKNVSSLSEIIASCTPFVILGFINRG